MLLGDSGTKISSSDQLWICNKALFQILRFIIGYFVKLPSWRSETNGDNCEDHEIVKRMYWNMMLESIWQAEKRDQRAKLQWLLFTAAKGRVPWSYRMGRLFLVWIDKWAPLLLYSKNVTLFFVILAICSVHWTLGLGSRWLYKTPCRWNSSPSSPGLMACRNFTLIFHLVHLHWFSTLCSFHVTWISWCLILSAWLDI